MGAGVQSKEVPVWPAAERRGVSSECIRPLQRELSGSKHTSNGLKGDNIVWVSIVNQLQGDGSRSSGPGDLKLLASGDTGVGRIGQLEGTAGSVHSSGRGSGKSETSVLHFE